MNRTETLDCRGMQCPAPILHIAKAARKIGSSPAVLEVLVDDADFPSDVKAWCKTTKAELMELSEQDGVTTARISLNGGQRAAAKADASSHAVAERVSQREPEGKRAARAPRRPLAARSPEAPQLHGSAAVALQQPPLVPERVDCRGMQCPAPILAISKAARKFVGQPALLEVLADDADFPADLQAWCKTTSAKQFDQHESGGVFRVLIGINGAKTEDALLLTEADITSDDGAPAARATGQSGIMPATVARRNVAPAPAKPAVVAEAPPAPTATRSPDDEALLDLRGKRAPEPILALSTALVRQPGSVLRVIADDPGFMTDVMGWATATKVTIVSLNQEGPGVTAVTLVLGTPGAAHAPVISAPIVSATPAAPASVPSAAMLAAQEPEARPEPPVQTLAQENRCTMLIIKNDFESLMAAMMCATTAAAQGMDVVMFFSFWGVNLLRGERPRKNVKRKRVSFLQRIMQWMMPKGPKRQKMSKMHMGGMGKGMMQMFMRRNNVMGLHQLMNVAVEQNVRFVVCSMSMGIMGIQKRDIMDLPNIEFAGVTSFIEQSSRSRMSLVF